MSRDDYLACWWIVLAVGTMATLVVGVPTSAAWWALLPGTLWFALCWWWQR